MTAEFATTEVRRPAWRPWGFIARWLSRLGFNGRSVVLLPPMLWLAVFFLIPLAVVFKISFSESVEIGRAHV